MRSINITQLDYINETDLLIQYKDEFNETRYMIVNEAVPVSVEDESDNLKSIELEVKFEHEDISDKVNKLYRSL